MEVNGAGTVCFYYLLFEKVQCDTQAHIDARDYSYNQNPRSFES